VSDIRVVAHPDARGFLRRAEGWLMLREDENNLALSLAGALQDTPPLEGSAGYLFATVEVDGEVAGCVFRPPPHKLCLTKMPAEAADGVVEVTARRYDDLPGVRGPAGAARAVAAAWGRSKRAVVRPLSPHRMYRLDRVTFPEGVGGRLRPAARDDLPIVHAWGEAFAEDAGAAFRTSADARVEWVGRGDLWLWEADARPVCMAVVTGRTRHGVRIGYVFTPRERRGRGFAGALTAALSQRMLDEGARFCVLYTDLANPTSNALYARVGYRPLCDELELEFVTAG
jgi:GNAT superfamily N-acetyltransferase